MEATAAPDLVPELRALVADAVEQCGVHRDDIKRLWADRDDPVILSEIVSKLRQLRQAELAVAGAQAALAGAEGAER